MGPDNRLHLGIGGGKHSWLCSAGHALRMAVWRVCGIKPGRPKPSSATPRGIPRFSTHRSHAGSAKYFRQNHMAFLSPGKMICMLSLLLLWGVARPVDAQSPAFDEYQLKAAFLY